MAAPHDPGAREEVPATAPVVAPEPTGEVHHDRVVERRTWSPTFGPGMLLGALGAIGVVVACFTEWHTFGTKPDSISVDFLWDRTTTSVDPSLLILLIPIALVLVVGAVIPAGGALRLFGGLVMLVLAGVYAYQLDQSSSGVGSSSVTDVLGTGWYIGAIGGFLAFISGFVPDVWAARREVVRSDTVDHRTTS